MMSESCCTLYIAAGVQRAQVTLLIWNWWQVRPMGRRIIRQEEWGWTWLGCNMLVCYTFFSCGNNLKLLLLSERDNSLYVINPPRYSTSLCHISLFLGCWNMAKGGENQIAEFENCRVWEMQNLRNAEFENCKTALSMWPSAHAPSRSWAAEM